MKLIGVTKRYGEKTALDGIDFELEEGKITAVLGESGAGKSTFLDLLSGLAKDYEGKIEGTMSASYLFQEPKLLPHLTVEGNLRFVLREQDGRAVSEMLERVGLRGKADRLPKTLSGGERQRAAIARAFLYPHELLLMDEPFSSLDLALKKSLIELVVSLWRERRETVVFVTHDVREAVLLAERAVVLREGRIVGDFRIPDPYPRDFFAGSPVERDLVATLMRSPCESENSTDRKV